MTSTRYDAVFFDFGGVFIDSPFAVATVAAERLGMEPAQLLATLFGPYENDTDHPWHRLERGELSFDLAREEIRELFRVGAAMDLDPITVLADLAGDGTTHVRHGMVDLVRDARTSGLRTGIITNNIAEFGGYWRNIIPLEELFDDVVDSSEVKMRKPGSEIYRLACARLDVDPDRSVFVDDFDGNVIGARAVGLTAVCCGYGRDTTDAAVLELRDLLGL